MAAPLRQPLAHLSDQELVKAYQSGADAAFLELVERYRLELFHFLARFLNDRTMAEDIFQEAFLQVHLAIDTFDTTRPLKPWLFTIAANKARDYLRKTNRMVAQTTAPLDDEVNEGRQVVDLMDSDLPIPDQIVEAQETRILVQEVVADLPPHLKEILVMAYFHQIPYKDIAQAMGIPLGTVKSRLHAAVGTFAQLWRQRYDGKQNNRTNQE